VTILLTTNETTRTPPEHAPDGPTKWRGFGTWEVSKTDVQGTITITVQQI